MASRSFRYLCLFLTGTVVLASSAWNGHTPPGSTTPAKFTPYYVAKGTKSYDSSSKLIQYTGDWSTTYSSSYVGGSAQTTRDPDASVTLKFHGTGCEWFGNLGPGLGKAQVYIDGKLMQTVDAARDTVVRKQQRVFALFTLPFASHTLKIKNIASRPILLDALVITQGSHHSQDSHSLPAATSSSPFLSLMSTSMPSSWTLVQKGSTGVAAMQLAVISDSHALIIDKVEHNTVEKNGHPAWATLYNLDTHALKPLTMQSNSFCAGGTFLSNGTMINVGGNPVVEDYTAPADFGDTDGRQAIRIFEPCEGDVEECDIYENHARDRMASPRWYPTVLRISDGSAMIIGGSKKGGWINNATVNNPTFEYWPPKSIHGSNGFPVFSQFFVNTLNSNLFPLAFSLPDGRVFIAANNDAMIYDWKNNKEELLPALPNGVRVTYPMAGTGLLLPLSPENNYAPQVLICGGSTIDDHRAGYDISSKELASAQCSRMLLTQEGILNGWQVEQMPAPRLMPDAVLLPTGEVVIVNGAGSGVSGYGNTKDQVGQSNADNPVFTPVLYTPGAQLGNRFSSKEMPTSDIPRMYHSVATLTPKGDIMIAGSNPNLDRSEIEYGTEYRVEWLSPPYMKMLRPFIESMPKKIGFGKTITLKMKFTNSGGLIKVALMDLGFKTHAVQANARLVYLVVELKGEDLIVHGPPNGNVYPPGPAFLYVLEGNIPSVGKKIMVGNGEHPPFDKDAWNNVLAHTGAD